MFHPGVTSHVWQFLAFFCSLECDPKDILKNVLAEIDLKSLDTLRYHKHASKGEFEWNFYDKAMVDVSRVSYFHLMNCHRILSLCNNVRLFEEAAHVARNDGQRNITPLSMTLLRVHLVMDSWEKYGAREDTRRTKDVRYSFLCFFNWPNTR